MDKVYIVTDGDYSDYRIVAVFSTEEQAKDYIQCTGRGDSYAEYEVDVPYERKDRVWEVVMRITDHEVLWYNVENQYDNIENCLRMVRNREGDRLYQWIKAETSERAIKIANERIGQILAGAYMFYKNAFLTDDRGGHPYVSYTTGEVVEAHINYDWQD